jgi:hypothetical protein
MKLDVDFSDLHAAVKKMTNGNANFQLKKSNQKPTNKTQPDTNDKDSSKNANQK